MLKVILMLLMAVVVCSNAMAEWVAVDRNETRTTYADPSSIRKAGNRVEIWYLHDYKTVQLSKRGTPYMSKKVQAEYDCKVVQDRILYTLAHSGKMGEGAGVFYDAVPSPWGQVQTGTVLEALWKFACGRK